MYLREALLRCSLLIDEGSELYASLASGESHGHTALGDLAEIARKEDERARLLRALGELFSVLGNDGPFLVHARIELAKLSGLLATAKSQLAENGDHATATRVVELLETCTRDALVAELFECAEPELCRVLRVMDAESRAIRRNDQLRRSRQDRDRREKIPAQAGR